MLTNINYYNNSESDGKMPSDNLFYSPKLLNEYALYIPRKRARGESNEYLGTQENAEQVEHYEFHIEQQVGSWKNRRDAYVYLRLPKSKMLINIVLHADGGVSFDKKFHRYALRELDSLDRRIVLGFCDKYHDLLVKACYSDERDNYLDRMAANYKASDYKKRIDQGSKGSDMTEFHLKYNGGFMPYEESTIFKNIQFIN